MQGLVHCSTFASTDEKLLLVYAQFTNLISLGELVIGVPNQFETPLVELEEDPASPQEILRESLELLGTKMYMKFHSREKIMTLRDPYKVPLKILDVDFMTIFKGLTFFGGGDDEGSASKHLGTVGGSTRDGQQVRHQQIEVDPSLVPLAPHQKLNGISMAR
ncbi:hypothetical protein Tco_0563417 [Tanacetum coccineum]